MRESSAAAAGATRLEKSLRKRGWEAPERRRVEMTVSPVARVLSKPRSSLRISTTRWPRRISPRISCASLLDEPAHSSRERQKDRLLAADSFRGHAPRQAPVFPFERDQVRKEEIHRELRRIPAVDAGEKRLSHALEGFLAEAPADEGGDGLFGRLSSARGTKGSHSIRSFPRRLKSLVPRKGRSRVGTVSRKPSGRAWSRPRCRT